MEWQNTPYTLPLVGSAVVLLNVAIITLRYRHKASGARALAFWA